MGTRASRKAGALGAVASVSTGLSDPRPRLEGSLNHRTPSFQAAPHRAQRETPAWQTCPGPSLRRPLASLRALRPPEGLLSCHLSGASFPPIRGCSLPATSP